MAPAFHPPNRAADPAAVVAVADVAAAVLVPLFFVVVVRVDVRAEREDVPLDPSPLFDFVVDALLLVARDVELSASVGLLDVMLGGCGTKDEADVSTIGGGGGKDEADVCTLPVAVVAVAGAGPVVTALWTATLVFFDTVGTLRAPPRSSVHGGSNAPPSASGKHVVHAGCSAVTRVGIAKTGLQGSCGYGVAVSAADASAGTTKDEVGFAGKE
ncbi:hypothetical protein SLS54_006535 [Diplodia seriata]